MSSFGLLRLCLAWCYLALLMTRPSWASYEVPAQYPQLEDAQGLSESYRASPTELQDLKLERLDLATAYTTDRHHTKAMDDARLIVAFEAVRNDVIYLQSVAPLMRLFMSEHPNRHIEFLFLPSKNFEREVLERHADVVIASSGTAVTLMLQNGLVPIASRVMIQEGLRVQKGALLVTLQSRQDLTDLASLRNTRLALTVTPSLGPLEMLQGRLLERHFSKQTFFQSYVKRSREVPDLINTLVAGYADVILLPSCSYERLISRGLVDPTLLKPVGLYNEEVGVCLSSTRRYPDWVIGYMPTASDSMVNDLTQSVVNFNKTAHGAEWSLKVDLTGIQHLMQQLHYGPYQYLDRFTWSGFIRSYRNELLLVLGLFVLMILHALRANYLVRVKTRDLRQALQERDALEKDAQLSRERLSAMERVGMLSQMSSMFAHELKQPLASLTNYIGGLKIWVDKSPDTRAQQAQAVLSAMQVETKRITQIVDRVRGYAKSRNVQLAKVDLAKIMQSAIEVVQRHDSKQTPLLLMPHNWLTDLHRPQRPLWLKGDELELELLVVNLIRNAMHAASAKARARVHVGLFLLKDGRIELIVQDNGPRLSATGFERLMGYGQSVKQEGLGIGLSICRGILDQHGAQLRFEQANIGDGIEARVIFPKSEFSPLNEQSNRPDPS